jgi:sulfur-oxidizing protein SoxZ
MVRVLISVPKSVARNEPFEVKVLISHPMESGQRRDQMGQAIPRDIIHHLIATMDGETILDAGLFPAIAANPFFAFSAAAEKSGTLALTFTDDHEATQTETVAITVT